MYNTALNNQKQKSSIIYNTTITIQNNFSLTTCQTKISYEKSKIKGVIAEIIGTDEER